ncbi:hypothetical protein KCV06_g70, partial [Aureobasidium melanogenum]
MPLARNLECISSHKGSYSSCDCSLSIVKWGVLLDRKVKRVFLALRCCQWSDCTHIDTGKRVKLFIESSGEATESSLLLTVLTLDFTCTVAGHEMSVFYLPCNGCWNSGSYLINEALISRLRFTISLHPYGDLFFLYHIVLMPANERECAPTKWIAASLDSALDLSHISRFLL